jgi:hypothetical protein
VEREDVGVRESRGDGNLALESCPAARRSLIGDELLSEDFERHGSVVAFVSREKDGGRSTASQFPDYFIAAA